MSYSDNAVASFEAEESEECWLVLLTIDHAELSEPLRIVNNIEDIVSRGDTYVALPFEIELPGDGPNGPTPARLRVDNVHQDIVAALRLISTWPTIRMEAILADAPDDPELTIENLTLRDATYDASYVTGTLRLEDIDQEPIAETITPSRFPGCF